MPTDYDLSRFFPESASTVSGSIDLVFIALVGTSLLIIIILLVMVITFTLKYRAGSTAKRDKVFGNTLKIEIGFMGLLTVVFLGLFVWAAAVFYIAVTPPENAKTIYVVGKQWMWKVQHQEGARELNELHVPVDQPIRLVMTSQDVIHSFFIPAFRVKQDLLPKQYTSVWFEATKTGEFPFLCAEYCGLDHSKMLGTLYVMPQDEFNDWLETKANEGEPIPGSQGSEEGQMQLSEEGVFYTKGCNMCHLPTSAFVAPRLDGLYMQEVLLKNGRKIIADEQYIRESIMNPNAKIVAGYDSPSKMPTFKGQINEQELLKLIEFIQSIQHGWPEQTPKDTENLETDEQE